MITFDINMIETSPLRCKVIQPRHIAMAFSVLLIDFQDALTFFY